MSLAQGAKQPRANGLRACGRQPVWAPAQANGGAGDCSRRRWLQEVGVACAGTAVSAVVGRDGRGERGAGPGTVSASTGPAGGVTASAGNGYGGVHVRARE